MFKKFSIALGIIALVLFLAFNPWQERNLSARLLAKILTARTGFPVSLASFYWDPPQTIVIRNLSLKFPKFGEVTAERAQMNGERLECFRLRIKNTSIKRLPFDFSPALEKWVHEEAVIDKLVVKFFKSDKYTRAHVLVCDSPDFHLAGGVTFYASGDFKGHALIWFPHNIFERLPFKAKRVLLDRKGNWHQLRLRFSRHSMAILGEEGPYYELKWK